MDNFKRLPDAVDFTRYQAPLRSDLSTAASAANGAISASGTARAISPAG